MWSGSTTADCRSACKAENSMSLIHRILVIVNVVNRWCRACCNTLEGVLHVSFSV